ncbi:MAG TPA: hypothetical protein VKQ36_00750, partial [Ktedonobacterales bacterium]|nr:hypothetical protein [Ktedonobacterales bacterium]
ATAFLLGYEMSNQAPTIKVNGVTQTVGILNVDSGKQWYYQQGSNVITQDSGGTALTSGQTLQVVYVGQYPNVTTSQDAAGVLARQAREGGSTSGIVESVAVNATLTNAADALQEANGYLARYNQDTQELDFMTQTVGFQVGQTVTANVPGLKLNNVSMIIESVTITDQGPIGSEVGPLYYTIVALQGPPSQNGARFWLQLLRQSAQTQIDSINVGQSGVVVIPQSGAVALSWSLTGSAALLNLLFPSSSKYPSPSQYPGGSSGGSVSLTWKKTNAGLNAIRDALSGAANAPTLAAPTGYLAWGTGTPPSDPTATHLGNEVGRKPIASVTNGASVGEELITAAIGPNDGVGAVITEVAIFYDATESGTANTGIMMLYASYSHTHTNAESITITADSTIS